MVYSIIVTKPLPSKVGTRNPGDLRGSSSSIQKLRRTHFSRWKGVGLEYNKDLDSLDPKNM